MKDFNRNFFLIVSTALEKQIKRIRSGRFKLCLQENNYNSGPRANMPVHHVPELFIQLKGQSKLHFPKETVSLSPGAISIVQPHSPHREEAVGNIQDFLNLVVISHDQMLYCHLGAVGDSGIPEQAAAKTFHSTGATSLEDIMGEISSYAKVDKVAAEYRVQGLLLVLMARLLEETQPDNSPDLNENLKVFRCKQLIAQYLDNPELSVSFIAAKLGFSADYLSFFFHDKTGIKFTNYVHNQRVEKATKLLTETSETIYQIASSCGFSSTGYFIRLFKKSTCLTPKNYRSKHRRSCDSD